MYVYALGDPRTGDVCYVGMAQNAFSRYAQHITAKPRSKTRKDQWIDDLKQNLMIPTLIILESDIPQSRIAEREIHWIEHYLALGAKLTNTNHVPPTVVLDDLDYSHYISAQEAACILSQKLGRSIDPCRINKLRGIRYIKINTTTFWYHKDDIMDHQIRDRRTRCQQCGSLDCTGHEQVCEEMKEHAHMFSPVKQGAFFE